MAENFYNPFPIGTVVYDLELNRGVVTHVIETDIYPIKVMFNSGEKEEYKTDGRRYMFGNVMLSTKEMKVIPKL